MPTSWYHMIPRILGRVLIEQPRTILDVGTGFGKYGVLLRETLDVAGKRYDRDDWQMRIDGIEVFAGYRNPIHSYVYDHVYYDTVENVLPSLGTYDVILLIDVLEHFEKDEGRKLLRALLAHTGKALIVSTPVTPAEQGAYLGNAYETHRSRWTVADFAAFQSEFVLADVGDEKCLLVKIYPNTDLLSRNRELYASDCELLQSPVSHPDTRLNIAYVMPHTHLTGGVKVLLEQIRWLKSRGHKISVYLKSHKDKASALPDWNRPAVDGDVVLKPDADFSEHLQSADVVVAGWVEQLPELCRCNKPVLYIEQGSETLFGDQSVTWQLPGYMDLLKQNYSLPCTLGAVSDFVAEVLEKRYGRKAAVLPCCVDTDAFCPGTPPDDNVILLAGNPSLTFKGFDTALRALELAWRAGTRFSVQWVCQVQPDVQGVSFPVSYTVNPPQQALPGLFRQADILLFTSWYEGFGLPPLEAMASGLAVVCTRCGGPAMYLKPETNALTALPGDVPALALGVARLCTDENLRRRLSAAARKTALDFSAVHTMPRLEELLIRMHEQQPPA